jgi:hypothetical protein
MLRGVIITAIFCLWFAASFSQIISTQRKEDLSISKFHKATVSIPPPGDSVSIPIHSISVLDARPDSSAIGLYQIFDLDPRFIVTGKNFRSEAELFVNKYVHGSKSDSVSVLMILKKFWISTGDRSSEERKIWNMADTGAGKRVSLFTKIEFYLCKDSAYYALYRFDSVFTVDTEKPINIALYKQNSFAGLLTQTALKSSLSKLTFMDGQWRTMVSSKRKFTRQEIEAHERKFFEMSMLKDSLLVSGVYLTFDEFKDNSPAFKVFEVTKDKLNDFIYTKESSGRQMPLTNAWGYCDSNNQVFIRSGHNYFKLQRRQNAFYIYGSNQTIREVSHSASAPMMGAGSNSSMGGGGGSTTHEDFSLWLKPFQLDWDTGKLD